MEYGAFLENEIKKKTSEKNKSMEKLEQMKREIKKNEALRYHQIVDMTGITIEFDNDNVSIICKEKEQSLTGHNLKDFSVEKLF